MSAIRDLIAEVEQVGAKLVAVAPDGVKVIGQNIPPALVARLRPHKADLFRALTITPTWDATDWRAYYGERPGIDAFQRCVDRWVALNPPLIPPAFQCVHCGTDTCETDLALALRDCERNAWVHARCHRPFMQARRAQAVEDLARFGIADPLAATTAEPGSMGAAMKGPKSEQAACVK